MAHIVLATRRALQDASRPFASSFGLSKLPEHADVVAISSLFFLTVHQFIGPRLSKALFPRSYGQLKTRRDRNNWNIRVVSLVHALVIIPLAFRNVSLPALDADRAFGWDSRQGLLGGIACGYFIWDTLESLWHFTDIGFVVHGLACLLIYMLSFKPFIAYYGPRFLLWELSTPFLNFHWFLDKMNLTGSIFQLINGLFLLSTFAGVRLIYGSYQSIAFYRTLYSIRNEVPLAVLLTFGIGNVILNGLNVFWFFKMIDALRRRMKPSSKPSSNGKDTKGKWVNGRKAE
ncbi:DUF887-domain-containing protein [Fomitiporia mediterranea MF3/22]|uniref:DUF887-domain-containing protein n=1 Tax=Fomitiporia mediterranea (strain MF3/22) TaxID=694068 RepID=UPI00044077FB|nr:DUF887-domain-containing protein [Fomitiporia mediterranea MF3/22]EJD05690.1 DUF887-domain-containing protein [Fomitiporia mediterranea MF3/22]